MKLTVLLLVIGLLQVSASSHAQQINLSAKNISYESLFKQIEKQSGYSFLYDPEMLKSLPKLDVEISNATIDDVLNKAFRDKPVTYLIIDKNIVVRINTVPAVVKKEITETTPVFGKVTDEKGSPLTGVTIKVKGTNFAWVTDKAGEFRAVIITPNAILQFSSIGFVTTEYAVKDIKGPLSIVMKEDIGSLNEIQVLAYGTTTKRFSTGNIVSLKAADIEKSAGANILDIAKGRLPGLGIQQLTGVPGGGFATQVRSISTFNSNSYNTSPPLFIVDGVAYPAGSALPFLGGVNGRNQFNGGNALNYLNPGDIESFEVLKDADATSIYGSRGTNGVILITTKKAKAGDARLIVNAFDGISKIGITPQLLNTDQYLMIRQEALKNDGLTPSATDFDLNGAWSANSYTDWRKYYLGKTAQDQNADITYTGGNGVTNFLMSGNIRNQGTVQLGSGSQVNGGIRFDINNTSRNKKFFIDLTGNYTVSRNNLVPYDFSTGVLYAPNAPLPVKPDGSIDWSLPSNPAAPKNLLYNNSTGNLIANTTARYDILPGLSANLQVGFNLLTGKEYRAQPSSYFKPSATSYQSTQSVLNWFSNRTITIDPNISYVHKLLSKGSLEARAGFTLQDVLNNSNQITGTNFSSDALLVNPTYGATVIPSYNQTPTRYTGAFATIKYNWDNKYIVSLNGRRDGSTNFGPGNRFGNFGSVAGAWIITEEKWLKNIKNVLSFAKLRASYGTVGNDQIGAYQYLNTYQATAAGYLGNTILTPSSLYNPTLHWEKKRSSEVGLDLQFFNGRFEIDGDFYRSWTNDQLLSQAVSTVTGFPNVAMNVPQAKIYSHGFEFSMSSTNIKTGSFSWRTNVNLTIPESKLISFPGLDIINQTTSLTNSNYVLNKPITGIKLYNYAGVNPQTGNYQFINAAGVKSDWAFFGPGSLNSLTDNTQFIDLAPKFYGGFGNTFTYKQLSLDVFFTFQRRALQTIESLSGYPGVFNKNLTTASLKRWQKPGDITDVPRASSSGLTPFSQIAFSQSTGAYTMNTYAKLTNLNVSYDLKGEWLNKAKIQKLSIYMRGENLLTISKYKSLDPESLASYAIGPLRTVVLGLNITL